MFVIDSLHAIEILDSRGRPTLAVRVALIDGSTGTAGVPSGASTGRREAVERRDGDPERYEGRGVLGAVSAVNGEIAQAVTDRAFDDLAALDTALVGLDGTPTKARLGANAVVGVSMAAARAIAAAAAEPLWRSLARTFAVGRPALPGALCFNVVNGGAHAPNDLDFQEFMITPLGAPSVADGVRAAAEVYAVLRGRLTRAGHATGLGDEGGFAPMISRPEDVLGELVAAIQQAGYLPGPAGVAIALDPAASQFADKGRYVVAGERLTTSEMIARYEEMVDRFPIWSIEDGLAEDDWDGWQRLTAALGERIQLVGDDLLVTDPATIEGAIRQRAANAALIKVNQVGTVTEALQAMRLCHEGGWPQMVSHRSGETVDDFIADLVVGTGCGQLKSGAPARGERVAKYNRLLEIEATTPDLPYLPAGGRRLLTTS